MATIRKKISGCYRRVLTFLLVIVAVGLVAGGVIYRQVGGREGARHWMVGLALSRVEKHLKSVDQRPDGISEDQIVESFQRVREATQRRQINLVALYAALKSYQAEFNEKKPSTPEVQTFLRTLEGTILQSVDSKN